MENKRFGHLVVIVKDDSRNGIVWLCQCDCGNKVARKGTDLRRRVRLTGGQRISCGCIKPQESHGQSKRPVYRIWQNMKNRCYNKNTDRYYAYGGRGIIVCDEWINSFDNFYAWAMQSGYQIGLSIDRIDVNGNYSPENCQWVPLTEQKHNKRDSRKITWNGETLTPRQWADKYNIPFNALQLRISRKWTIERIFTQPFRV